MISQETIQQILSRIDIIEIVGGFVRLKKRGINYIGLCPFHNEKTPSFTVSPTKEIYKCFGCGRSGNSVSFLMEHEKYSYVEALRWLAAKYNVEIEETGETPEQRIGQQVAESLHLINAFAQKYFTDLLFNDEEGRSVGLSYLKERGLREDIITRFQLGYSLRSKDAFAVTAIKSQYNPEYLQKAGLIVVKEGNTYDNYRGRIIFPVHNQSGKVIGFGARVIGKADKSPKYINTPENEIYVKSRLLYGMYFARHAIGKADECFLVEGYTDVISLHQAGIENTVASGGTSLTVDQLRLIKKHTENLTILYDGDAAGVKAALRGLDLAIEEGLNVKLVLLPDNEDPDSYVTRYGAARLSEFIHANKKDFILFQLDILMKESSGDPAGKSAVVNTIAETIARINKVEDFTRQQDYIRQSAALLKIDESGLHHLVNKIIRDKIGRSETKSAYTEPLAVEEKIATDDILTLISSDEINEKALVRCMLEFGLKSTADGRTVAQLVFDEINNHLLVDDPELQQIIDTYQTWYNAGLQPTAKNFLYHEDQQLSAKVVGIVDFPYELSPNWKQHFEGKIRTREELFLEDINSTLIYLKLRKIKKLIEENQRDLQSSTDPREQVILIQTHEHLKQMQREILLPLGTVIVR